MINLLPPQQKRELSEEEQIKSLLVLLIVFIAFFICFNLIFYSVKIYISGQLETQKILLNQRESENLQLKEVEQNIKNSNKIFSDLKLFYQTQPAAVRMLEEVSRNFPPGIKLNSISLIPVSEGNYSAQVSLSGNAPTIKTFLEFKERLETEPKVSSVEFLNKNWWLETVNINFSVNFRLIK